MSPFIKKAQSAFGFLVRGELFLFFRALVTNLLPDSLLGMGKLCLYSLDVRDSGQASAGDGGLALASEGPAAIADLARCYESQDLEAALPTFRDLGPDHVGLWCARDTTRPDRPVVGAAWVFRRKYVVPFDGYDRFSLCLDLARDDQALLGTVHVHTDYRRRGLFSRLIRAITDADPKLHLLSSVSAQNFVSIAAHKKIGFRTIGTIYHLRIGSRLWCYFRVPGVAQRLQTIRKGRRATVAVGCTPSAMPLHVDRATAM